MVLVIGVAVVVVVVGLVVVVEVTWAFTIVVARLA